MLYYGLKYFVSSDQDLRGQHIDPLFIYIDFKFDKYLNLIFSQV